MPITPPTGSLFHAETHVARSCSEFDVLEMERLLLPFVLKEELAMMGDVRGYGRCRNVPAVLADVTASA